MDISRERVKSFFLVIFKKVLALDSFFIDACASFSKF